MTIHRSDIIPTVPVRSGVRDELDIESICIFLSLGFFLGQRTFYRGLRQHPAASVTVTDEGGHIVSTNPHFEWHYTPREMTFRQAVDEFTHLFESLLTESGEDGYTIPVSGGLDSRSLVAACQHLGIPYRGYAYAFRNGIDEKRFGWEMSRRLGFPFQSYDIEPGTLWSYIDRLSETTECYAEFTHARQYAVFDQLKRLGGRFLLGHAGDIFFDGLGLPEQMTDTEQLDYVWSKYVKPSGFELASAIWKQWGCSGDFREYLLESLRTALSDIRIQHPTARLRAFKVSTYFNRLSCTNLAIFRQFGPVTFPYCDDRIVQFACTVPERWLDARQIQIEYIKRRSPVLASVTWQDHRPYNLYTYKLDRPPLNFPYRAYRKVLRNLTRVDTIRRNWELQFVGDKNAHRLHEHLLGEGSLLGEIVDPETTRRFLMAFQTGDAARYFPATTMLVTLASFLRLHEKKGPASSLPHHVTGKP